MTDFLDAVAQETGVARDAVAATLDDAGVVIAPTPAGAHSLMVTRLRFSGTKHIAGHAPEPFDFDRSLGPGLWIVASQHNLAGKSTVLNIIRWALTGRPGRLRDDVRSWIDHVTLEGTVDTRRFQIDFDDSTPGPRGSLSDVGGEIGSFETESAFESITGSFFSDRLGLDPTPFWQRRPAGAEDEGDARRLGWQGYFPALHVRSGSGPLLGDQVQGGQPGTLMQVFLGLPWALTAAGARVGLAVVRRELSAVRRRSEDDRKAREKARQPLRKRLEVANQRLAAIDAAGAPPSPDELDALVAQYQHQSELLATVRAEAATARDTVGEAQRDNDTATRRAYAVREGLAVRPLLGRLAPTECPRCSHQLDDVRQARESHDHCFVCDAPLSDLTEDEDATAEAEQELRRADETLEAARAELRALELRVEQVLAAHSAARVALDTATKAAPASAERETVVREKAVAEALLAQDETLSSEADDLESLQERESVLDVAQGEAVARRALAGETFRARLGEEIVDLGRRFGIENLEEADPKLNASLRVVVGGVSSNFGDLSPGEQLRLRIAVLIGLLRIGTQLGIGRFPGLLMVDSPGSEEMASDDASEILREVASICDEQESLQVIVATARPDLVTGLVADDHWLGAGDLGMVF
jgi:hypothetical protein